MAAILSRPQYVKHMNTSCEIIPGWMPQNTFKANNGLGCRHGAERQQANNHCWPSSLSARDATRPHYSVIMPQCLNNPFPVPAIYSALARSLMMASSNGNIFRVTGPCASNSPVTDEFPSQKPVTRIFDVFSDLRLNKLSRKQSRLWRFETL